MFSCESGDGQHPEEVRAVEALLRPSTVDELNDSAARKVVNMTLYRPHRATDPGREGIHARPAETVAVRGVIGESAISDEGFGGNALGDKLFGLRDSGEFLP